MNQSFIGFIIGFDNFGENKSRVVSFFICIVLTCYISSRRLLSFGVSESTVLFGYYNIPKFIS